MNKYFIVPVAACVAAVSLAPIAIHAQGWTKTFETKTNVALDYTFTVEFNDVANTDRVERIVVAPGESSITTDVEYAGKYAYVTVQGLQNNASYELQVYLKNGSKYNMAFSTVQAENGGDGSSSSENPPPVDGNESPNKAQLEFALENYISKTKYLSLKNSLIYTDAVKILEQYKIALANKEDVTDLENQLNTALANITASTDKIITIDKALKDTEAIVKNGPHNIDKLQTMFDNYLMQLDILSSDWKSPTQISANGLEELIINLKKVAANDPKLIEVFIDSLYQTLETYSTSSEYLELSNTALYSKANELFVDYELSLNEFYESPLDENVKEMLETLNTATKKGQELQNTLLNIATSIESGPYNIEEMQELFETFVVDLNFELFDWETPDDIKATNLAALETELKDLSTQNPYKSDLLLAAEEVRLLLMDYRNFSLFPNEFIKENYYITGNNLATTATKLSLSKDPKDDEQIIATTAALEDFASESESYVDMITALNDYYSLAQQSLTDLKSWQTLFPTLKTEHTEVLESILSTIKTDLMTKPYTNLATNIFSYEEALSPYAYEFESMIEGLLESELEKYNAYYSDFFDTETENWLESSKFLAFEQALDTASFYDILDIPTTIDQFKKLRSTYNAL